MPSTTFGVPVLGFGSQSIRPICRPIIDSGTEMLSCRSSFVLGYGVGYYRPVLNIESNSSSMRPDAAEEKVLERLQDLGPSVSTVPDAIGSGMSSYKTTHKVLSTLKKKHGAGFIRIH